MAKYAPSALIGRISRSAGGTTFGHNRFGSYFRNRVIPTNPVTPAQTAVRVNLAAISSSWRALSDPERLTWQTLGANITRTDTLGQTYTLTGQQAYILVNRNRHTVGLASLSDAPAWSPPSAPVSISGAAVAGAPSMTITFAPTPIAAGHAMVIMATRPLSPGVNFQSRGAYKIVSVLPAATATGQDIDPDYEAVFGPFLAGQKILLRAFMMDTATGLASAVQDFSLVAS